ncbi:hypothetical protein FQN57_000027 [Myotisia sp. PD_48]|nr:hypothetical protein FQN57_000027 [Myotisia sp. PD_48]
MSTIAARQSESPRMNSSGGRLPYRDYYPHPPPSPTYARHASSTSSSPKSPSFPPFYKNQFANSSAPDIYSPTAMRYPFHSGKHGRALFQEQQRPVRPVSQRLPDEVYEYILCHLMSMHTGSCGEGCLTCYMRDLYSLSLTNRAWEKAVRGRLYNKIHLHGIDSPAQLKKYKWKRGSRLRLLRRTLRQRQSLANSVFELRVPELESLLLTGKQHTILQEYRDLVASVVMVCPNLERLLGLSIPYTHKFDRLTHALSTRRKLKEHIWIIGDNPEATERARTQSTDILQPNQVYEFLSYHISWSNLESLMLHSLDCKGILEHGVFLRMLNFLPSLQHLAVSHFDTDDFTDRSLLFLPHLTSLRLENLPGITENGLARFVSRLEARSLESLTIIEQNISSLLVISKILASLTSLKRFQIVQSNVVPVLPEGGMVFQPILASATLKYLHWDVACPNAANALNHVDSHPFSKPLAAVNTPNSHLAQSILHAGFPALEYLRAPLDIDPLGALQASCRPSKNGQIMVPNDRHNLPRSSHGSLPKRPLAIPAGNNLSSARIRGQTLIDIAAKENDTGIKILVTDHSLDLTSALTPPYSVTPSPESEEEESRGATKSLLASSIYRPLKIHEFLIPACLGRVGRLNKDNKISASTPRFTLDPDIPNSDADGGLISWKHLLAANQTSLFLSTCSSPIPPNLTNSNGISPYTFTRVNTNSSLSDELNTPSTATTTTTTTSFSSFSSISSTTSSASTRFATWGGSSNVPSNMVRSAAGIPPSKQTRGSTSPMLTSFEQPFWARDTCNGSWNQRHKLGKEWWSHVERERTIGKVSSVASDNNDKKNTNNGVTTLLLSVSNLF